MKLHPDVRLIPVHTLDQHGRSLIQHIYDLLLDIPVEHVVQRIDAHHIVKDFLIPLSDPGHGKGDDRKAVLLALDILVLYIGYLSRVGNRKLLLLFTETAGSLLILRHEGLLPEALHHRGAAVKGRQLLVALEHIPHRLDPSLRQRSIQKKSHIFLMVIVVLLVGIGAAVAVLVHTPALKDIGARPAKGRL